MTRRPTLVAVSGPPGAGKTTLAHALADALGWPAICRDEIKERMAAADADPADHLDLKTLEAFFRTIGEFLKSGTSLVAEAAFQDRLWRPGLEPLADLARIRVVRCVVDPELARVRIARRASEVPSRAVHADADRGGETADRVVGPHCARRPLPGRGHRTGLEAFSGPDRRIRYARAQLSADDRSTIRGS